ncbi:MAG: ArnT family glycosyltransferase [Bryobacteraceae bacterium]
MPPRTEHRCLIERHRDATIEGLIDRIHVPACILLFIGAACLFIPSPGIQSDEALFGTAWYEPAGLSYETGLFGRHIPLMLMSYLGALKAWLYAPIFAIWRPSALSVRLPAILAGAATIWLFYRLVQKVSGERAARIACALLACDAMFVLTTTLDWGPVALQHLLTTGGALAMVSYAQTGTLKLLALGSFLFGLGTWDKALFLWMLSGLIAAAVVVCPKELWRLFSLRSAAVALGCYCLGAAPLIAYNVRHPLETFRSNTGYSAGDVPGRVLLLKNTLDGSRLFSYIARDEPPPAPRSPEGIVERASVKLSEVAGRRQSWLPFACLAALALAPWLRSGRVGSFCLIAFAVAWAQMLFAAKGAGGGVHHVVLLWPLPHLFVADALARASERLRLTRVAAWAAAALVAGSSLLVINEYKATLVRNGGGKVWTDAIWPLSESLGRLRAETVFVIDWGMLDQLILLHKGSLPLRVASDPLSKTDFSAGDRAVVAGWLRIPGGVFVSHTDDNEEFQGVNARLRQIAGEEGCEQQILERIPDRHGRAMFEVWRFESRGLAALAP